MLTDVTLQFTYFGPIKFFDDRFISALSGKSIRKFGMDAPAGDSAAALQFDSVSVHETSNRQQHIEITWCNNTPVDEIIEFLKVLTDDEVPCAVVVD